MHARVHALKDTHTRTEETSDIHACIHVCMKHERARTYTQKDTHTHTYIHKYIHTYIRTYIHTYTPCRGTYAESANCTSPKYITPASEWKVESSYTRTHTFACQLWTRAHTHKEHIHTHTHTHIERLTQRPQTARHPNTARQHIHTKTHTHIHKHTHTHRGTHAEAANCTSPRCSTPASVQSREISSSLDNCKQQNIFLHVL